MDHDYWSDDTIGGQGSVHDVQGEDPRNPRLAGLKSVSYAAAVAMRKQAPAGRRIGFHVPRR